jgi:hypothetical protein
MSDRIESLKLVLVKAREANEQAKQNAGLRRINMETTPEGVAYKKATEEFATASEAMLAADKELREAVLNLHEVKEGIFKGGEISPGVTIQFHHKIKYELDKVIEWAKTEARNLFVFDVKAFEDSAKKGTAHGAPFEKYDEPFVKLATKNEDFNLPKG